MLRRASPFLLIAAFAACVPVEIVPNGKGVLAYRTETGIVTTTPDGKILKRFPDLIGKEKCEIWFLAWSPDDRRIAFVGRREEREDQTVLAVLDTEAGKVRELVARETDGYYPPRWSPDGSAVSYVVAEGDHRTALRIVDLETGDIRTLAKQCAAFHAWSPDGGSIAIATTEREKIDDSELSGGAISLVDVATGEAKPLVRVVFSGRTTPVFDADGRLLFNAPRTSLPAVVEDPKDLAGGLYAFDLGKGTLTALHREDENVSYVAASPSGERILYVNAEGNGFLEGDVIVMGKGIEGRVGVGRNPGEDLFPRFLDEETVLLQSKREEKEDPRILLHRIGREGSEDVTGRFPGLNFPEK